MPSHSSEMAGMKQLTREPSVAVIRCPEAVSKPRQILTFALQGLATRRLIERSLSISRHASEMTDEQWSKIEPLIPNRMPSKKGGRKRVEDRRCFEGILRGCFAAEHGGRIFHRNIHRPRRAGGDCRSGRTQASGWISGASSSGNSTRKASCHGTRRSATGSSRPETTWPPHRQNETRKGYKAYGGGRRPGQTSGISHFPNFPGGSHAHRVDARASSRPSIRTWPSVDEAATAHLRQGRRQRGTATAAQEARDRADLSSSIESQKACALRRSFATPLPPPRDHRKDGGMARKLPHACRQIRAQVQDVPGLPEGRLSDDHASSVLKPLLVS